MKFQTLIGEQKLDFDVQISPAEVTVTAEGEALNVDCVQLSPNSFSLIIDGGSYYLSITEHDEGFEVTVNQQTTLVNVKDETQILLERYGFEDSEKDYAGNIQVPIPGLLVRLFVTTGDVVEKDQKLFILEAMKMENEFNSPVAGTVKNVLISEGKSVDKGDLIMEIEMD